MRTDTVSKRIPSPLKLKRGAKLISVEMWREGGTFVSNCDFGTFQRFRYSTLKGREYRWREGRIEINPSMLMRGNGTRYQDATCWYAVEVFGVKGRAHRIFGLHRDREFLMRTCAVELLRVLSKDEDDIESARTGAVRWLAAQVKNKYAGQIGLRSL